MKKIAYFLIATILTLTIFSCQEDSLTTDQEQIETQKVDVPSHRNCGSHDHTDKLMEDPEYAAFHANKFVKLQEYEKNNINNRSSCANPPILPVAVHFQGISNPDVTCLIAMAEDQIEILNDDFAGTNSDISNWTNNAASSFPGISNGQACIAFQLANQNHPSGFGLTNGDLAITVNQTTGDFNSNWSGYLNIYVQFGTGVLGYSPLGGSGNGDGVVIEATAFGSSGSCGSVAPGAPFNLGRTTTHEVGHYLLLDHIWGGGCGTDDDVADTPNSSQEYYDCPNIGASSCGSTDMHMNYMDYTNDACMYMFSAGQATRSENYIASSLSNLTGNASTVIGNASGGGGSGGGGTTVTCSVPTNLTAAATGTTTADVSFTGFADAIQYKYRYAKVSGGAFTVENITLTNFSLTGLEADTEYKVQVRTQCPTGWTAYTALENFTTQASSGGGGSGGGSNGGQVAGCDEPVVNTVTGITSSEAQVSWTDYADATLYKVGYRKVSGGGWTIFNSVDASLTLSALSSDTEYRVKVRARCVSGWTPYSNDELFTTTSNGSGGGSGGGSGSGCTTFNVKVTTDDYGNESSWFITDDNNDVVASGGPYNTGTDGDVFNQNVCLPDGCYTLSIDDSYGDGMCCSYGDGGVELINLSTNNVVVSSDGQFAYYEDLGFCVTGSFISGNGGDKDTARNSSVSAKYERGLELKMAE